MGIRYYWEDLQPGSVLELGPNNHRSETEMKHQKLARIALCAVAVFPCALAVQTTATLGGFLKPGMDHTTTNGANNPAGNRGSVTRVTDNTSYCSSMRKKIQS